MKLLYFILMLVASVRCHHILCIFPVPSHSHNILGKGIVDALLHAGHEVTWATPYPPSKPVERLTIIDVSVTRPFIEGLDMSTHTKPGAAGLQLVKSLSRNISFAALTPELKTTVVEKQFDAIVTEFFFTEIDSGYAAVQQAPWIVLSSVVLQPDLLSLMDQVSSVPIVPMMFTDFPVPMNFWQRLITAGIYLGIKAMNWYDYSINTEYYEKMFSSLAKARGVTLPPLEDALSNVSILLVNSHPSFAPTLSLPPNVVDVAGYHMDVEIPPLSEDIKAILDSSPQGVIYFSLGSMLKSSAFPQRTTRNILKVFSALPYTVMWKYEDDLENIPNNVYIRKWMPQTSILAHPNLKVFLTHGGMLGFLESLQAGVPIIAMPVYGDQSSNAGRAVRGGYGLQVEYNVDTLAGQLDVALKEMLSNDSYYEKAKQLSRLFNNRPVAPSKIIAHSIEVAIESKGAYHLRSLALLYPWYQRCMIDIAAFIIFVLATLYVSVKKVINSLQGIFNRRPEIQKRKIS